MRGLNNSLLEVLQAEITKNPFSDLENVLTTALKNYSRHIKSIKATQDTTANPKPIAAPSPPAGGFLFGGKSLPTSGTSTPVLNPAAPTFMPLKPPSAFPTFIAPGSSTKTTPESKSDPADDNGSVDKSKDTRGAAAPPSLFGSAVKPAASTDTPMEGSTMGEPKESTEKTLESTSTSKVSPFKPSVFGGSAFGTSTSAFKGAPVFGTFGASTTQNDKVGEKESPKSEVPKSAFGTTGAFGSAAAPATFGGFGASSLPPSGSIGNPVGFSFGSSLGAAKKDDTTSTTQANGADTGSSPGTSPFGGASSSLGSNTKPSFGSSAFGAPAKSVFGSSAGTSLFGSGGAFGSTGATKTGEGPPTPTSSFGSTSSFGAFGAGPSVFNLQATPAPLAAEASGESQETESETPITAFEFASTDIEGAGEEDETSVYTVRGKLLKLVDGKWTPLGLGHFKIKKHKQSGKQRVLFRTEGNGHVVAVRISQSLLSLGSNLQNLSQNFNIFADMKLTKQAKLLRFPGMEGSHLVPFGLQLKLPSIVDEAYDALSKASSEVKST
jgi:nucleoporin NUP2